VSLIGTLEQFSLAAVLQRCERYEKTGLLTLKQGPSWIEFYLNAGRLLCIGPLRTSANLGERLLYDGLITPTVLQETLLTLQTNNFTEAFMGRTLIELGYVSREELRNWTIKNTVNVLNVVLNWSAGEVYFDENTPPPTDRLLVSMSITGLIEHASAALQAAPIQRTPSPSQPVQPAMSAQKPSMVPSTPSPDITRVPTLMDASQFLDDSSFPSDVTRVPTLLNASQLLDDSSFHIPAIANAESAVKPSTEPAVNSGTLSASDLLSSTDFPLLLMAPDAASALAASVDTGPAQLDSGFVSLFGSPDDGANTGLQTPVMVAQPVPPKRIDTSFMRPNMVLLPADLSAHRRQNPQVQLTPDQWCLLTYVDGQTPLVSICQALNAAPEIVCQVAGELIAAGLIYPSVPAAGQEGETSPVARELQASGLGNGYVAPGYASATASPWSASMPAVQNPGGPQQPGGPIETESQWGNGGNGATFVPGRGWTSAPQPMQPLQSNVPSGNPLVPQSGIYASPLSLYKKDS
jgi:hypothetical protein